MASSSVGILLEDIQSNGKLIDNAQIDKIKRLLENEPDGRYTKKYLSEKLGEPVSFSISKVEDQYFAIYKGFKKGKALGSGMFGGVKLAQNIDTGEWSAIKIQVINDPSVDETERAERELVARNESNALKKTNQGFGSYLRTVNQNGTIRNQFETFMKYAPGETIHGEATESSLESSKRKLMERNIPTAIWIKIAVNMLKCVKDFHNQGYLHRDIKIENFRLNFETGNVKLVDLGFAIKRDLFGSTKAERDSGTYLAPEVKQESPKFSKKTEVYSLGMVFDRLFTGLLDDNDVHQIIKNMLKGPKDRPSLDSCISEFTKIQRFYIDISIKNIALLDVKEYMNGSAEEKASFIAALKNADRVYLMDTEQHNPIYYCELQKEFNSAGINLDSHIFYGKDIQKLITLIPAKLDKSQHENVRLHSCFHVSLQPCKSDNCSAIQVEKVRKDYKKEYNRDESISLKQFEQIKEKLGTLRDDYAHEYRIYMTPDPSDSDSKQREHLKQAHAYYSQQINVERAIIILEKAYKDGGLSNTKLTQLLDKLQARMLIISKDMHTFSMYGKGKADHGIQEVLTIAKEVKSSAEDTAPKSSLK